MRRPARLALVLGCAAALALLLHVLHLPAAWMFGPLIVSAFFAVRGEAVTVPRKPYLAAQALIGTALGAGFLPETLRAIPQHAGIFIFAVVFILAASLLNGWVLARYARIGLPTALLGTIPGGASAMAALSDSLGADTRLVAAMQYVRLLIVLGVLAAWASLLGHGALSSGAATVAAAPLTWEGAGILAALGLAGWGAALTTPIPAAAFLVPTFLYFGLTLAGVKPGIWPWPVLAVAYGTMGLQIGGRFHPSTIAVIRRVIIPVIGTTLLLLVACMILAWVLARRMGIPFASAYLAATPGGLDSVAAVATALRADTTIILAIQLTRVLCILLFGPWLVRGGLRWLR